VIGYRGQNVAAVFREWADGLSPWEFDLSSGPSARSVYSYVYTDRNIYRPGQVVYFKGILRDDNDAIYGLLPVSTPVTVTVTHDEIEIWKKALPLSAMGTISGELALNAEAALGSYRLDLQVGGREYYGYTFEVAEYRKPEFQVALTPAKKEYQQGETISAGVEASYFFGGAVADAAITWRVMRRPWFFDRYEGKGYWEFTDFDYEEYRRGGDKYGGLVSEGKGKTDARGQFTITLPANIKQWKQSQTFSLEASVTDLNNQEVSASGAVIVHKGSFYLGLSPASYVATVGQEAAVRVISVDTQGLTRTQQALEVVFSRREWFSAQEKDADGILRWTNKARDTAVMTRTVKTDAAGLAVATFTPTEGGVYRVAARGLDERENEVRSATYMWVSSSKYVNWSQENNNRFDLVADKKSYRVGETAQVLIATPFQGEATALVTIERGGVLEHKVLTLKSNSEMLSLPIAAQHVPNVYVSVVVVKGVDKTNPAPAFRVGYVELPVSAEHKELRITITPERKEYHPRDKATYEIAVRDVRGQGVAAEVSLQLVDLAVESLSGPDPRNILTEFYRRRGLGVRTASSLSIQGEQAAAQEVAKAAGKGGGGGVETTMVRQNLVDTAYWAAAVRTDPSGIARVTIDLPDNLTTWRMTAQALTAQTEVGKATQDIVSNLEVMIRPVTPRFLVIGDKPRLGAVVHNNTAAALNMTISLEAQGAQVDKGTQTLSVPSKGRQTVSWPATVGAGEGATLRFKAVGGAYSDAIEITLPVLHPSTAETVGTAGEVNEQILELVRLPDKVDATLGELTLQLEPSLAAGMRESLRYLRTYPYECIEQTVSRFLPNVATYRALQQLGVNKPELRAELTTQVGAGLQRLYALQNPDGGWGWWANDKSSAQISAYVLLGLAEAARADFSVDAGVGGRALNFLTQWLEQDSKAAAPQLDLRAMVIYAMAEAAPALPPSPSRPTKGSATVASYSPNEGLGRAVVLYGRRSELALYGKAYLVMALAALEQGEKIRATTVAAELANDVILSATGAHWEEKRADRAAMNTDVRTTALVLRALVRAGGKGQPSALLANAVRWLMTVRSHGRWETTQENA
jgi:uncharacterized protein YfaS (alpha-2-macroglobulin family)